MLYGILSYFGNVRCDLLGCYSIKRIHRDRVSGRELCIPIAHVKNEVQRIKLSRRRHRSSEIAHVLLSIETRERYQPDTSKPVDG